MIFFPTTRLLHQAIRTIRQQNEIIVRLQNDKTAAELAYMRIGRDLIEQFLISLDTPENHDVYRERLTTSLGFYRDEIAVREEHVG
jgi:hypothetical protein